jgi:hypothetical protein
MALVRNPQTGLPVIPHQVFASERQLIARASWEAKHDGKMMSVEKRKSERTRRSPAQQIKVLDKRLGEGVGAHKERARLAKLM